AGVFANTIGTDFGALSDVGSRIYMSNDAILEVNASATLGQPITVSSGNAAIEVQNGITVTTSYTISAASIGQKLYKKGKGTLNLNGGSTMNRLVIEEGTVNASELNNVTNLPKTVEFINGVLRDPDTMYSYSTNPTNYYVAEGNKGTLYFDSRCTYTGKLSGAGTFSIYATNVRTDLKGDWSGFEGEVVCNTQKTGSYDPDLKWDNNYGMPKATLNIPNGITFRAQGYNMKLGNIKGSGIYDGSGTLTIGNDDRVISFNGSFTGKPSVVKTGKCDLYMTKLMTEVTSLTVNDGTMTLNASKSPYNNTFLTSPLTIEGNAKLRGRGTVADLTVAGNGILEPGTFSESNPHHYGPIFSSGNVTVNQGATLSLYLRVAGKNNDRSYLNVKGNLRIDGHVKVTMNPEYVPAVGDEFKLWITDSFAGTPTIELPELPEGLAWDFSGLQDATGILKVIEGTGVSMINDNDPVVCKVFDVAGLCIGTIVTTKDAAPDDAKRELGLTSGLYFLRLQSATATETIKIQM
ncbi:MAG: hypothetical protein K2J58_07485, partial [Muribaculaceae bacterium]|nr:hypothetical protein [Muribaculaceae bacterium]